ncbi:hypothetical protein EON63_06695 [archaeon]|nr:MAG: hypothetical protein EON63_06695 [archaeon]
MVNTISSLPPPPGSFDNTVKVWDVRNGRCVHTLTGHQGEISSCQFNFASDLCISGALACVWMCDGLGMDYVYGVRCTVW